MTATTHHPFTVPRWAQRLSGAAVILCACGFAVWILLSTSRPHPFGVILRLVAFALLVSSLGVALLLRKPIAPWWYFLFLLYGSGVLVSDVIRYRHDIWRADLSLSTLLMDAVFVLLPVAWLLRFKRTRQSVKSRSA